jgi:hypothetical protein
MKSLIKELLREALEEANLFHGSSISGIKKLSLKYMKTGEFGYGIYLTTSLSTANAYGKYIYKVTLNKGDYFDGLYTKEQLIKIKEAANKNNIKLHKWMNEGQLLSSNWMYEYLSFELGGDKNASEFLKIAGIDGKIIWGINSYGKPIDTDRLSGKNYVVFDENDVTIISEEIKK